MDPTKYMIIAKGNICTHKVRSCVYNSTTRKWDVTYMNGKRYSYVWNNVSFLRNPKLVQLNDCILESLDGMSYRDVKFVYEFDDKGTKYWHFVSGRLAYDFKKSNLTIKSLSTVDGQSSTDVWKYLKEISVLSEIPNDYGEVILKKYYDKVTGISKKSVLYHYLNPNSKENNPDGIIPIFPFGCNESQYTAVDNALRNQISVIQGPPGTGKTQTILNIISNLIINNKSVIVVSNNNSATRNVLEKLSSDKYGLGFIVAPLGSAENKKIFIESQTGKYPDMTGWEVGNHPGIMKELMGMSNKLHRIYQLRESLAVSKQKLHDVELEYKYFEEYLSKEMTDSMGVKYKSLISSEKILNSFQELQQIADESRRISKWFVFKSRFVYGIGDKDFYSWDISKMLHALKWIYYRKTLDELNAEIEETEKELSDYPKDLEEQSANVAFNYLKAKVAERYKKFDDREYFSERTLISKIENFLYEYPVVLSTTFSARACLNPDKDLFDYVIMDEASQVDVTTGALALSVAKNAVIVGDQKQLPNVVSEDTRKRAEDIKRRYSISSAYDYTKNSFLTSVISALPNAPITLLREHYRCHPQIISFCNHKFYNDELIIMTKDDGAGDALKAIMTVEGNHSRGHYNQRQIDIIKDEVLPGLNIPNDEIGIIAPYNSQVDQLKMQIPGIDISTVHKFQGREKDVIILSTVDDEIGDFTDDPYLLNVAVSRAKKKLIVIVSGNNPSKRGNIADLVSYIRYNNMEITDSKVYSIFDYLYSQYREQRWQYLKKKRKISQYDSENLTYNLLLEILKDYPEYGVQCFTPLSLVVKDASGLSPEEVKYANNPATHLDFLIYNKVSKMPVAAVETDGYDYHKEGTEQHERDLKKNHILEICGIPLIRLSTNGSNEKGRILDVLGLRA